jgi:hypothetical protein
MNIPLLTLCAALLFVAPATAQHDQHHAALNARGARFMGFSQEATTHHFLLTKDGGRIQVTANDAKDAESVTQIREHLRHIAEVFGKGDFALPGLVHDTKAVPGVDAMKQHGADLTFTFEEIDRGAHVRIAGTTPRAVAAVHDFLKFQITDHRTGDSLVVK